MILIINTSGNNLEFVLNENHKSVVVEKQSVALPIETEKFINECGAKWSDLTAIGVVVGPGSFTGIRLGIAYAKGLAMGLKIPVVGINLFDLYLAQTPDAFVAIKRGDKFKHLEVIGPVSERKSYPSGAQHNQYLCRCDCGNLTVVTGNNLKNGNTSSCGCHQMSELGVKHRKPKYTVFGVCPVQQEERVKYSARLQVSGEMLELGTYYTEEEAIIHRLYAEKKYLGYDAPQKHLFAQYGIV